MSDAKEIVTPPVSDATEPDPNAPWSPEEGLDESGLSPEQVAELRATMPVVQEVLDWFEEQILSYLNPNVVAGVTPDSDPQTVKDSVLFAQRLSREYSKKRNQFVKRFEPYLEPPKTAE